MEKSRSFSFFHTSNYIILASFIMICSCGEAPEANRQYLDLSGTWQFSTDTANTGVLNRWYTMDLSDSIRLPGTTDLGSKGVPNSDTTTMHLNRLYKYEGPAWYRKRITIPEHFRNKHVVLIMERTKTSTVWIDDQQAGGSSLLQSPHFIDITKLITPGEHTITIRIDNNLNLTPYGNVHIYSDDTQTNWNGIIGKFLLEAAPLTQITDLQVFPDIEKRKIDVVLSINNGLKLQDVNIALKVKRTYNGKDKKLKTRNYHIASDSVIHLEYRMDDDMMLWDEYRRPLYELTAVLGQDQNRDSKAVTFGMRKFSAQGTQFNINGRVVFLRGKHDACVFPLTGFPPMDVEGWVKIFQTAKSYGINHYRFHSWCPPEAAFKAADLEGIYLQAELPFWGGLESDSTAAMLKSEGLAMLKNYANHPSFVLFSHGNEIWSGHDLVEKNILSFKEYDNRPLYTLGSNNNIGYVGPRDCADFFVAARTPYAHDTILTHTRLTHAFADSKDGGILNTEYPSTEISFDHAVSQIRIPIISHEIGQYQIYPDYNEIEKYTGVLRAWNLEVFRNRLQKSGMLDQNKDFQRASGAWSAICYKAEMETALRTKGLAGFQLLDLQDFPGQGTALVGILDAFMDDKGVIDRNRWLQSCNDVVLLMKFPRYCWTNAEEFKARVLVANYSENDINDILIWELVNRKGETIQMGKLSGKAIPNSGISNLGSIEVPLNTVKDADQLSLNIRLQESGYSNSYPLWVYPGLQTVKSSPPVIIADKMDTKLFDALKKGARVLLFPTAGDVSHNSVDGLFPPEFWNYGMFKGISEWAKKPVSPGTLGILTRPDHPALTSFPTEFHTNWQWFSIIKAGHPLILNKTDSDYRPIVQVIDNLERNDKMGLIFEFKAGEGKLLVCMSRLPDILDKPEAVQLYNSLLDYMKSELFDPHYVVNEKLLIELFN